MHVHGIILVLLASVVPGLAEPAQVPFSDCTSAPTRSASNYDPSARLNVSNVYAQIVSSADSSRTLKLVVIGETGQAIQPSAEDDNGNLILSTLFTRTTVLTFTLNETNSWFCRTARPSSPLPSLPNNESTYCPIGPGPLAFSISAPLHDDYNLTTIVTRVRVVDPNSPGRELACIDVHATPVRDNHKANHLGYPQILFWLSAGLVMAYWVVIGLARIAVAWGRGVGRRPGWSAVRAAGTVFASAVSAERLSTHSALLRFATPSWRDVMFHTQWCAALAMIAVQWPRFSYPILANAAWATLLYNVTLTAGDDGTTTRWNPLASSYSPPSTFQDQLSDNSSPLYLDSSIPNGLYILPDSASNGLSSLASSVGIRPQDVFPISMKIWLGIVAAAVVISSLIWAVDWTLSSCLGGSRKAGLRGNLSPHRFSGGSDGGKEGYESTGLRSDDEGVIPQTTTRSTPKVKRWWHYRLGQSSFHGSVLQGNLVRLLILFHFPITIFSTYEFTRNPKSSPSSIALSVLTFALISVILPALLLLRLALTPTKKLYDATRTLLALGPLYSHYAQGSQMFAAVVLAHSLAVGVTIGAGQRSGTVQAIIILVLEVASALATSIWLPWGERASMGVMSFLFCVARIVTVVLLIILTPLVSVGDAAGGWIAYAIIVIQGLIYLAFLLMLVVKVIEGLVRLFGRVPFDKSTHSMDSGLLGALSQAGCCGKRKSKRQNHPRSRTTSSAATMLSRTADRRPSPVHTAPASFLRPEQAFLPYREDADDESGFIMGAWAAPFPSTSAQPTYQPISTQAEASDASIASSGFARVGGGRAHADSPFAIATGEFAGRNASRLTQQSTPISVKAHQDHTGLPPGAMAATPPSRHMRTQSHVAIIENAPPIGFGRQQLLAHDDTLAPPHSIAEDGESSASSNPPKKTTGFWQRRLSTPPVEKIDDDEEFDSPAPAFVKGGSGWFSRLRNRSEGDSGANAGSSGPSTSKPNEGGSSFVVVRNKKPSAASTPSPPKANEDEEAPKPFVVVRPQRNSGATAPNRGGPPPV